MARDIIRWMDEWLSDRERGGFYASQDADISMDDDGDYFTWTLDEAKAVLTEEELAGGQLFTMTSTKLARCITIRPRMCSMSAHRSKKLPSG